MQKNNTIKNSREIHASVPEVFAAFSDPVRLAKWWGPSGFTNTFHRCEFKDGGRWSFIMHGPDGKNYPNESVFVKIEQPSKIVIHHVCEPIFLLTVTLSPTAQGTLISWLGEFDNEQFLNNARQFLTNANEQNFDRLTAEVLSKSA